MRSKICLLLLAVVFIGCSREQDTDKSPDHEIMILGHRGSGNTDYNDLGLKENTIPSVLKAMEILDGVEVDIQMSRDSVIYLFHNSEIPECGQSQLLCIPVSHSSEIEDFNQCLPRDERLPRLEELFEILQENGIQKYISLDVKASYAEECIAGQHASEGYQKAIAGEIARLIDSFGLTGRVFAETNYSVFLDELKRIQPQTPAYLLGYSNLSAKIDYALEKGYEGISFNAFDTSLTKANVRRLHENGLLLQLWTPNEPEHLREALKHTPHFIQTDNVTGVKAVLNEQ